MKRIGISITIFLLSVLLLIGSGGFTVGKMVCLGNGHVSYSLGNAKDCCEKEGAPQRTIKSSCCNLINIFYSLDDFSPASKIITNPAQLVFAVPAFAFKVQVSNFKLETFYSDLPPPDIKDRLHSFCSLLL
jgi:hypothetical protein